MELPLGFEAHFSWGDVISKFGLYTTAIKPEFFHEKTLAFTWWVWFTWINDKQGDTWNHHVWINGHSIFVTQPNLTSWKWHAKFVQVRSCYHFNFKVLMGESCHQNPSSLQDFGPQANSMFWGMFRKTTSQSEQRKTCPRLHVTAWDWRCPVFGWSHCSLISIEYFYLNGMCCLFFRVEPWKKKACFSTHGKDLLGSRKLYIMPTMRFIYHLNTCSLGFL